MIVAENGKTKADAMGDVFRGIEVSLPTHDPSRVSLPPPANTYLSRNLRLPTTTSQKCEAVPRRARKAHRLLYHSTLDSRVIKKKKRRMPVKRLIRMDDATCKYRGTSLIRNCPPLGPYSRPIPRALRWS